MLELLGSKKPALGRLLVEDVILKPFGEHSFKVFASSFFPVIFCDSEDGRVDAFAMPQIVAYETVIDPSAIVDADLFGTLDCDDYRAGQDLVGKADVIIVFLADVELERTIVVMVERSEKIDFGDLPLFDFLHEALVEC